jgi:hypothetical protein
MLFVESTRGIAARVFDRRATDAGKSFQHAMIVSSSAILLPRFAI